MAREVWTNARILNSLKTILPSEGDKYSDIPGWEGEYMSSTDAAILLYIPARRGKPSAEIWFPMSQLRIAEDKQSIYASQWILEQKGLV